MLFTPEKAIEIVLLRKTGNARRNVYATPAQQWTFWLATVNLIIGVVAAFLSYFLRSEDAAVAAVVALYTSSFLAVIYQALSAIPEFRKMRNVEREMSATLLEEFKNDIELINQLANLCEKRHLSYARSNYVLMAKQLRERIAILVGAIEKVGVLPLAITGYFSFVKLRKEALIGIGGIEWILVGILIFYLFAVRMTATAQWMERIAEIYEHAIALKMDQAKPGLG